jgi:hypothetical protein
MPVDFVVRHPLGFSQHPGRRNSETAAAGGRCISLEVARTEETLRAPH